MKASTSMLSVLYVASCVCVTNAAPDCPQREYGWSSTVGGEGMDTPLGIVTDPQGNVYVAGGFFEKIDFDPSKRKDRHKDKGTGSLFVTSYGPERRYKWTSVITSKDAQLGAREITINDVGELLLTGSFRGKVDFHPGRGRDKIESNGATDIFLTILRTDGSYGWTRTIGGRGEDQGFAVTIDSAGSISLVGYFHDTVDFNPGPGVDEHTSNGAEDVFVTKLGPDGSYRWTRTWGGTDINGDIAFGIATDGTGAVIVCGEYRGTVDFNPGRGKDIRTSNGERDFFITKLGPDGSYRWTHTVGGVQNDSANAVTVDADGNSYVTGAFEKRVDFNPRGGGDVRFGNDFFDVYVIKLGPDGSYQWTKTFGGKAIESGFGIALDGTQILAVTGNFSGTVDFDPSEKVDERTSNGGRDVFITRFTTDGEYLATDTFGGRARDGGEAVTFDADGNVLACGRYASQDVDFDPTSGVDVHSSNGSGDIFITKHYCGQCEFIERHTVVGKKGKIISTVRALAPKGRVTVECTGPGDPVRKSAKISDDNTAALKFKNLPQGASQCLITKLKDPGGEVLCDEPTGKRRVNVK